MRERDRKKMACKCSLATGACAEVCECVYVCVCERKRQKINGVQMLIGDT